MKMDTLETGRRTSGRRQSRANSTRSKSNQNRARTSSRKNTKASAQSRRGGGQTRGGQRGRSAQVTTNLNEIRRWAEERGGKPVSVIGTSPRNRAGLLRIDFPGYSGAGRFEEVSWDEWYQKFQESNLEFLYQDKAKNGQRSRFFKLVCRGTANGNGSRASSRSRSRSRSGAQARGGSRSGSRNRARR
jgi:hypothetical protein